METSNLKTGSVGSFKYKTVDVRTKQGLRDAEKLRSEGWRIVSMGWDRIQFEKEK